MSFIDNEPAFRWALLQDQMANDKLHEGIRGFAADADILKDIITKAVSALLLSPPPFLASQTVC